MKPLSERLEMEAESWESWNREFPEDQSPLTPLLLREAAALAKSVETAATGECMEVGDLTDCDGHPFVGAIIESTRSELRKGPPIVYRLVALVPLPQQSET